MTSGAPSRGGVAHPLKIIANIFISFIGAGVLGLPYAFKEAGLAEGIIIMSAVGYVSVRAMFLIIDCKYCLLQRRPSNGTARHAVRKYKRSNVHVNGGSVELKLPLVMSLDPDDVSDSEDLDKIHIDPTSEMTYGDLGFYAFGERGRLLVDVTVVVSQIGFCCAYLIFISENISTYVTGISTSQWMILFLPPLYLLCLLRKLEKLAIFSVFAQVSTILAFAVVFWFDFDHYRVMRRFHPREFSLDGFPFYFAIAIYCYEGAGMILSLENSLAEHVRPYFKLYFRRTMVGVTLLYIVFGCSGYLSFGPFTSEIITLNLPRSEVGLDFAMIVKCCLCLSLFFTYPLMMFPVVTIIEKRVLVDRNGTLYGNMIRLALVACSGLVVILIPNFANLMAMIGGTCCTLLAFILPGLFHLRLMARTLKPAERNFDILLVVLGVVGTVIATWDTVYRMSVSPDTRHDQIQDNYAFDHLTSSIESSMISTVIPDVLSANQSVLNESSLANQSAHLGSALTTQIALFGSSLANHSAQFVSAWTNLSGQSVPALTNLSAQFVPAWTNQSAQFVPAWTNQSAQFVPAWTNQSAQLPAPTVPSR